MLYPNNTQDDTHPDADRLGAILDELSPLYAELLKTRPKLRLAVSDDHAAGALDHLADAIGELRAAVDEIGRRT